MYATLALHRNRRALVALFAIALSLRVGYMAARGTLGESPSLERGYREYVMAGQRLLRHGTITSPLILEDVDARPSALMPPAYVALVAGVYAALGVESRSATLALQLINAGATSLAVVFVFLIALELAGRRAAWIAALWAAINPTLIGFTDYIWDTSLFGLGVVLAVWFAAGLVKFEVRSSKFEEATRDMPSSRRWLIFGAYLGLLALLNPALTLTYPLLVLWPFIRSGAKLRRAAKIVALTVLGWAVILTPWTVRNYVHFDNLIYVRGGLGMELWLGSCPEADAQGAPVFQAQFPLNNLAIQEHVVRVGEEAFIQECGEKARSAISADQWRFARLCTIRLADFLLGTSFSHAAPATNSSARFTIRDGITAFLLIETVLVAFLLIFSKLSSRDTALLAGMVLSFSLIYCLTHAQVRFRAPIEPILAILVGFLFVRPASSPS